MTERENLILAIGMLEGIQAAKPEFNINAPLTVLWDFIHFEPTPKAKGHNTSDGEG